MEKFYSYALGAVAAVAVSVLCPSGTALAAQRATVLLDQTPLYDEADTSSPKKAFLSKGAVIAAANEPVQVRGVMFYRVRATPRGASVLGYVLASSIKVEFVPRPMNPVALHEAQNSQSSSGVSGWGVRLLGQYTFFNLAEVSAQTGFSPLSGAWGGGAEVFKKWGCCVLISLRTQLLIKRATTSDPTGDYTFDFFALPVWGGLGFETSLSRRIKVRVAGYAGMSLISKFSQTLTSLAAPNVTTLGGSTFTLLGAGALEWSISRRVAIIFEGAYQILRTAAAVPSETGNGSDFYRVGQLASGALVPLPVSYSGFQFSSGLRFDW